jgi:predicted alpha/beta superfamily hydrolase
VQSAFVSPRPVLVYLPPDYETNTSRRYPVIYFHDGQNVFDARTSFAGEWHLDETAESLIKSGAIEPVIIVAVGNTGNRMDEYTPVPDSTYGGGHAADYARFLVQELKPRIDATYRTDPAADRTGVAGSSLGGLVSMYFALTQSDTFRRIGVMSPSVWWANLDIVNEVTALSGKTPVRIWEDIGTAEDSGAALTNARSLHQALLDKGWQDGQDLSYREYAGAQHDEAAWSMRVGDVLQYLYPPQ